MAELKTRVNDAYVVQYLASIHSAARRADCNKLAELMQKATSSPAQMWGSAIVGFGNCLYQYESGRSGEWFLLGFASRKTALSIYLTSGLDAHQSLLEQLGTYKTGKGCLYLKSLAGIDQDVLLILLQASVARTSSGKKHSPVAAHKES